MSSSKGLNNKKTKKNEIIKSKGILKDIKSKYILKIIFGYLNKGKSLDIIKYNKFIKDRINIKINDYKDYYEIYSPIEIELKPLFYKTYGIFININKENEKYFHIYFNNHKKERKGKKRNHLNGKVKIKTIKIIIDYQVKSFSDLFSFCDCLEGIYFKKFYRNNITNMGHMFLQCTSLKELNFSSFNTINVTNMFGMFDGCSSLKELDLSNFNTDNVTDMSYMFRRCSSLKKLDISNFIINKRMWKIDMFSDCSDQLIVKY